MVYQRGGSVYILSNPSRTVLYTGVTSDLSVRLRQHIRREDPKSFATKYNCKHLVYYAHFRTIEEAVDEEKRIKKLSRKGKERLIDTKNPSSASLNQEVLSW